MGAGLALVLFALLTAGNAFFVAAEFSLVTVDRAVVEEQASAGDAKARRVLGALKSLSFQLSGAQLGITITALLTGYLAEPALAQLIRSGGDFAGQYTRAASATLALFLATLISMLCGELLPKNAAIARPAPTARWTARPLRVFSTVFAFPIKVLNGSANRIVRAMGIEPQEELASARSPEELGLLAAISAKAGAIAPETATLLQRTIRFGDKRAAEAMTPRIDVAALPADATISDLLELAAESGHSRFPLYVRTLDQVVGIATVPDALAVPVAERPHTAAGTIASEPVLVPDSLGLDEILTRLRQARAELAIVVDEYGGTDGIISSEDLAEELVGEIEDEYDEPEDATTRSARVTVANALSPGESHVVSGLLREDELYEQTGFRLPEGPYETLGGFLMAQLGRIPRQGDLLDHDGWQLKVRTVERHRVEAIELTPPEPATEGQDGVSW